MGNGQRFTPVFRRALNGTTSWSTNDNTPTLDGTAGPLRTVTLSAPQTGWPTPSPTVVSNTTNHWTYTPSSAIPDGIYTVTATTSDGASTPFTVIIDTQPPSAVLLTGITNDSGNVATDEITNDKTLVVAVNSVTDPTISSGNLSVTAFIAGVQVGSGSVDGSGNATIDLTGITLTEGTHQLTLRSRDGAGNSGPLSGPFPVIIDAHTDTPLVQAIETDTGRSATDRITQSSTTTTLRGRAEANAPIEVNLNSGALIVTTTANSSGSWTLTVGALADGAYSAAVTATDIAGNSATAAAWTFTIDNIAPATPTANITDDRGSSNSDRLTNDQTLVVSGNAENDSDVVLTLTLGGTTHTRTVRATGTYNADFTDVTLAEGTWTLTVAATDVAGNTSAVLNTTVTIDTTLVSPTIDAIVDDTGRSNTDFRTQDTTLTINGTASTAGDVVSTVVRVDGIDYPVTGTNWSQVLPALAANASYPVTVTTTDAAGNSRQASRTIIIDLIDPTVTISAVSLDSGISTSDFITNDTTLIITGTANETDPTVLIEINEGATVHFSGTVTAAGNAWSADATGVSLNGTPRTTYTIFATPTDAAGNLGVTAQQALIIDTEVPTGTVGIDSLSTDSGNSANDEITNDTTPQFFGTYITNDTNNYVRLLIDGTQQTALVVTSTATDVAWDWQSTTPLADGVHTAQVQIMDDAGNVAPFSEPAFTFTIDTSTPVPSSIIITDDTGIVATDKVTNDQTLTISGNAEVGAAISVTVDSVIANTTAQLDGTWSVVVDLTALTDGTLASQVQAIDIAGNQNTANFSIVLDRVAPLAPVVTGITSDTGRSSSDHTTNDRTLQIKGTAEALSYVDVRRDGTLLGRVQASAAGAWTYDATATTLPAGEYNTIYTATATDLAGNVSLTSANLDVRIDSVKPPTQPLVTGITIDSRVNGDFITNATALEFRGTSDVGGDIQALRVQLNVNGTTLPWVFPGTGTPNWTVNHTLTEGTYTVSAISQDLAGNNSLTSPSVQVIVDTTPPPNTITTLTVDSGSSASDFITSALPTTISGTTESLATVTLDVTPNGGGAAQQIVVTANSLGAWSATVSGLTWSEGIWNLSARALDRAGNLSAAPATQQLMIDQTAPAAPVITTFADNTAADLMAPADSITADNSLLISGTGEAATLIRVSIDGVERGTATVTGGGTWSFAAPVLLDGAHTFTATATDAAGNLSPVSNTLPVTIDTVIAPPVLLVIFQDTATNGDRLTNDQTQMLIGRAEAGSSVSVTLDGQVLVVTAGSLTGLWVADFTGHTLPAGGNYPITMQATDVAGNTNSGSSSLTLDITAPAPPVFVAITDDTGASSTDFSTSDNTLILTGTAEANSTVDIFVDGVLSHVAQADGSGAWFWDERDVALADGIYDLTAQTTDRAGNTSALTAVQPVEIDTAAPNTVQIRAFSDDTGTVGDGITADRTLILNGVTEPSAVVTITRNGVQVATVTAGSNRRFISDQTSTTLADGTYSYIATSRDLSGNIATSQAFRIQVDGTAPLAPVLTGIRNDSATAGDWITNDNTLEFTGTAEAYAALQLLIDDQAVGTTTVAANGQWLVDLTTLVLPDGSYVVRALATDVAGNISPSSATRTLVIDASAPNAPTPRVFPDTGDSTSDGLTNADPAGITGRGEPGARLTVRVDNSDVTTLTVALNGIWTLDLPALIADDAYTITTFQRDAAGNTSATSPPLILTVDRSLTQPEIEGLVTDSGLPSDFVTNDNTATLTGRADPLTRVIIQAGGATIRTVTSDAAGVWTATPTDQIADGTYLLTLLGEDPAGNAIGPGTSLSVTIDTVAPDAPVIISVTDDTGVAADFITNDQTVVFAGTAEANTTLELFIADIPLGTTAVASDGSWTFDATFVTLPPGTFEVSARAIDLAANIGPRATQDLTIDIDTSLDVEILALTAATDSGVQGDRRTNADPIVLLGLAEPLATVTVTRIGTGALPSVATNAVGLWTISIPGLPEGTHQFQASSVDIASNPGGPSAIFTIIIDRTTPVPTIDAITVDSYTAADFITNDSNVTISGTAEANATVAVTLAGSALGSATANGSGAWSLVTGNLVDGDYAIQAVATDVAGNSATDASNRLLIIDTKQNVPVITRLVTDTSLIDDYITSDDEPHFEGTSEANAAIVLLIDGVQAGTTTANGAGAWITLPVASLSDGVHVAVVKATDRAGNVRYSRARAFLVDTVMDPPVITLWTPDTGVPGDLITADGGLLLIGLGEADAELVVNDNGSPIATTQVGPTGQWTWTFADTPLAHGVHSLTVTTTDLAGNSASSVPLVITVDTIAPLRPSIDQVLTIGNVLVPADGGTFNNRPTVVGTAEANARVVVSVNGIDQDVAIANANGEWTWQPVSALPPGQITFGAVAVDAAGNRSQPALPYVIFILADAREVQVNGCGTGSIFALMAMAMMFLMLRSPWRPDQVRPLVLLLIGLFGVGLQAEERFTAEQKKDFSTRFGRESLENPADSSDAVWEWGVRLLALPSPEDHGTELDGYGEVPEGDYDNIPSLGVFLRRSAALNDDGLRWGLEAGFSVFSFEGTSSAFAGSDAVYDYHFYNVPLEGRFRLDHALGENFRLGAAVFVAAGVVFADINGTATAGGVSQDIGEDTGYGLYTAYGAAVDLAWTFDDAREWTLFLEVGYLRGRTSLEFTDRIVQGGQVVDRDTYIQRVDHIGVTYGLGLMWVW